MFSNITPMLGKEPEDRTINLSRGIRPHYADKFDGRSIRRREERAARKDAKKMPGGKEGATMSAAHSEERRPKKKGGKK